MSIIIKSGSSGNLADVLSDNSIPVTVQNAGVPVSGSVSVSNFPATQPVSASALPLPTGASTAAKQPALGVSGTPSADVISVQGVAGGTAQPVSGTVAVSNFPGTQPVSGTVSVSNFPATQPVSATSLPLPANAAQETGGNLAALLTATTNGTQKSQVVNGSGVVTDVNPKGTQGANFAAVQQPKDSGRTAVILSLTRSVGITTEALVTLTQKKGTAVPTTGTSYTVAAGKTLRIQSFFLSIINSTAAINNAAARIRMGAAGGGAVTVASDIVAENEATSTLATISSGCQQQVIYTDGLEIPAGQNIGVSMVEALASGTVTIVIVGFEY